MILIPNPAATLAPDNTADDVGPSLNYYGLIQTGLRRTPGASRQIRASSYRVARAGTNRAVRALSPVGRCSD